MFAVNFLVVVGLLSILGFSTLFILSFFNGWKIVGGLMAASEGLHFIALFIGVVALCAAPFMIMYLSGLLRI
jgi:hypothetical protein